MRDHVCHSDNTSGVIRGGRAGGDGISGDIVFICDGKKSGGNKCVLVHCLILYLVGIQLASAVRLY